MKDATHNLGNTLDLILTDPDLLPVSRCICADFVSDHRLVICQTNIANAPLTSKKVQVRKHTPEKLLAFQQDIDLQPVLDASDLDTAVSLFEEELTNKYNKHFPIIHKTVMERTKVPWYDNELKAQKIKVRNRERVWLKYGEPHQWTAYKTERNIYLSKLRASKRKCLSLTVSKAKGDIKALYQLTNNMTSHTSENPLPPDLTNEELSEEFSEFFLNKILNICKLFEDKQQLIIKPNVAVPQFSKFSTMSQSEIRKLIMAMKTKSCELDPLPTHLLKESIDLLLPSITKIVNLSLSSGRFSSHWKEAIVRPLLKKSGMDLIYKSYRPVSNLQFISKLVERAVLIQFNDHCDRYDLIPDYQSAYREGYSCETAVLHLLDTGLWAMENQEVLPCLFLDLSAAFDTVDHDLFVSIMSDRFGFTGSALEWFDSYLRP